MDRLPAQSDKSEAASIELCFSMRSQRASKREEGNCLLPASCCITFSSEVSSPTDAPRASSHRRCAVKAHIS